ncbi:MAG: heparan-alpha-glucosaminide N-acetyltransferase domain-containing protein [Bacteroidales bacterium]|nr:heparan-alpha-glucosaminide N-acetyltransferase domain-containing protein [Bacteroidales bacterium]MCF8402735.1 heparan-alpha-glucosaminide N-acetyltransferase domain-containing protein [Bacteroidales bacterium]
MVLSKEKTRDTKGIKKQRFVFIDQFRGFIGVLMLLGHSSYYLNSVWKNLDPFDPLFPTWGQFILRYAGYLCAPGFLMMAGAMVWWSYNRRIAKGTSDWSARWHLIQRGIFLVIAQMTWVNSSWGGFSSFQPWHFGIIACIGISMIFLTLIISFPWYVRLLIAIAVLIIHPFLLQITYDPGITWQEVLMQTFVDSGKFNKYPVLPWFALSVLGSVMANGWLKIWKTDMKRIAMSLGIAGVAFCLAIIVRLGRGFGNIAPFSDFGSYSFFVDQKYPPSLFMNLWFFGMVVLGVALFIAIGKISPKILGVFSIPGKVPLFFYAMHLAIMGVVIKRADLFYREGEVLESLIGLGVMLIIMLPLCKWFYGVKLRSKNYFIQMI